LAFVSKFTIILEGQSIHSYMIHRYRMTITCSREVRLLQTSASSRCFSASRFSILLVKFFTHQKHQKR